MNKQRLVILIFAIILIAYSWWNVIGARANLIVRHLEREKVPLLYIAPNKTKIPGVLIAHGYAGSKQLMLGYGYTLAHAGYGVMLWDFDSHAANTKPLQQNSLSSNLEVAYLSLLEQPEVDPLRVATLGHSMGSGAVMSSAINNVERYAATVAVSPTGAAVTPSKPRNLLLQAGSGEGRFIQNAELILNAAGGENKNLAKGQGRKLVIIPNTEHIIILLSAKSHQTARNWLDETFGVQNPSNYVDRRIIWYLLHLLAWLAALGAIAPIININISSTSTRVKQLRSCLGLLIAPFIASGGLLLVNRVSDIDSLGGVLIGGAVGIWFCLAGVVWLLVMSQLPKPKVKALVVGVGIFALLWISFGAMAQLVWLQWLLVPERLQIFPVLSLLCFPWFLASGIAQQNLTKVKRFLWWLGQSVILIGGFILVLYLLPKLGFLILLLPLFPLLTAIYSFIATNLNEPWSYAIGCALFFGWTLAAAFPLAS